MSRSNMRGSVASFVVVGAVLAVLLLGSIYVVKTQLVGRLQDDNTQVAVNTVEDVTDDVIGDDSDDASPAEESPADEDSSVTDAQPGDAEEEPATDAEQSDDSTDETTGVAGGTEDEENMPTTGVTADEAEELPKTGPTETLGMLASLGLLTGAVTYYRRSASAKV